VTEIRGETQSKERYERSDSEESVVAKTYLFDPLSSKGSPESPNSSAVTKIGLTIV
jgi:hypothetical protein